MNARCSLALTLALASTATFANTANAFYAPHMGRFLSRDPGGQVERPGNVVRRIGTNLGGFLPRDVRPTAGGVYADGMNLYEYVGGNPPIYVDPSGTDRRLCTFFGHGYIECRDSNGNTEIIQFGPGYFGEDGYNISPYDLPGGFPIGPWNPSDDDADNRLKDLWRDLEKDRRCGRGSNWNPCFNCWVPPAMFFDYGMPKPKPRPYEGHIPPAFICFAKGTEVATEDGTKAIDQLNIGDEVVTLDLSQERLLVSEVVAVHEGDVYELYRVTISGESILTTSEHPFYVVSKGWLPVRSLKVGDALLGKNGEHRTIHEIQVLAQKTTVYNITVAGQHNYFVGKDGVLVHNKQ